MQRYRTILSYTLFIAAIAFSGVAYAQNEEGDYPIDLTDDDETRTYLVEVKRRKESSAKAVALYDYTRSNDDELSFQAGERVEVISRLDPDWWTARSSQNKVGLVPSNYFTYPVSSHPILRTFCVSYSVYRKFTYRKFLNSI